MAGTGFGDDAGTPQRSLSLAVLRERAESSLSKRESFAEAENMNAEDVAKADKEDAGSCVRPLTPRSSEVGSVVFG